MLPSGGHGKFCQECGKENILIDSTFRDSETGKYEQYYICRDEEKHRINFYNEVDMKYEVWINKLPFFERMFSRNIPFRY